MHLLTCQKFFFLILCRWASERMLQRAQRSWPCWRPILTEVPRTTRSSIGSLPAPRTSLSLIQIQVRAKVEKTHLLCKGKYHRTADLLFDSFGFSCFVVLKLSDLLVRTNPNQWNRRSAVQWYFPLRSNKCTLAKVMNVVLTLRACLMVIFEEAI